MSPDPEEPTAEEIARVTAWTAAKQRSEREDAARKRAERSLEIQQHLSMALVGKTVERVKSDAEYMSTGTGYENYDASEFCIFFTDGASIALTGNYDSTEMNIYLDFPTKPE